MRKQWLQSWGKAWKRSAPVRDVIPITLTGALFLIAALVALLHWGIGQSDFIVRAASSLALVIISIMVVSVIAAALTMHRQVGRLPDASMVGAIEAGEPLEGGIRFSRFRWWPFIQTSVDWRRPEPFEVTMHPDGGTWLEKVRAQERGHFDRVTRRFTVRDIFGLAAISFIRSWPASIRVLPRRAPFDLEPILRNVASDGFAHPTGELVGDIIEMRRYAPGDPLNRILWRTYARTRQLHVREPERSIAPLPSSSVYFVAGPEDERSAELVRTLIEDGMLGDEIIFGADGADAPAFTTDGALQLLVNSAHYRADGGAGLAAFARTVQGGAAGRCLVFLPGVRGPWSTALDAFVSLLPMAPTFLVTVDGNVSGRSRVARWFWTEDEAETPNLECLPDLHRRLEEMGGPVQVVHAGAGRTLTRQEIAAMGHP